MSLQLRPLPLQLQPLHLQLQPPHLQLQPLHLQLQPLPWNECAPLPSQSMTTLFGVLATSICCMVGHRVSQSFRKAVRVVFFWGVQANYSQVPQKKWLHPYGSVH